MGKQNIFELLPLSLRAVLTATEEINQDLRITAIYGAKICDFQDIATINSAVA